MLELDMMTDLGIVYSLGPRKEKIHLLDATKRHEFIFQPLGGFGASSKISNIAGLSLTSTKVHLFGHRLVLPL